MTTPAPMAPNFLCAACPALSGIQLSRKEDRGKKASANRQARYGSLSSSQTCAYVVCSAIKMF